MKSIKLLITLLVVVFVSMSLSADVFVSKINVSTITFTDNSSAITSEKVIYMPLFVEEQTNSTTQTTYSAGTGTEWFSTVDIASIGIDTNTVSEIALCGSWMVKGSTSATISNTGYSRVRIRLGTEVGDTSGGTFYYLSGYSNGYVIGVSTDSALAYEISSSTTSFVWQPFIVPIQTLPIDLTHLRVGMVTQGKSLTSGYQIVHGRGEIGLRIKFKNWR